MLACHVLKLFRIYNIPYTIKLTEVSNYLGNRQVVRKATITKEMIHTLIEKITEYGWNSKKGRDYRMVKEGAIQAYSIKLYL